MPKKIEPQLSDAELIQKKLHHVAISPPKDYWLDTGSPALNRVFGSEKLGLAYGNLYNIWAPESMGKTLATLDIAAMAQADGAEVAWMPLEGKADLTWMTKRGLDVSRVALFGPRVIQPPKEKIPRLITIEELATEVETWILTKAQQKRDGKLFVGVDSVAAMLTETEFEAGIENQNMRTNMAHPVFLGKLLRRWIGFATSFNVMFFLLNQVRSKPGVMFGNPDYQPGGRALRHYCSSIVYMHRLGGGEIKQGDKRIGFRASMRNDKNKVGHGSVERAYAGLLYRFGYKTHYVELKTLKKQRADEARGYST